MRDYEYTLSRLEELRKESLPENVTEVFNNGKEAYYKVKMDFSKTFCEHPNATKEEHLTGDGAMEYVEWYDNYCPDCNKKWTTNE